MNDFIKRFIYYNKDYFDSIVFTLCIALVVLPFIFFKNIGLGVSLSLGVVAASNAQTDEHYKSRFLSLCLMMLFFSVMAFGSAYAKLNQFLDLGWVSISSFLLLVIGGYSNKLKKITFGSLLIGIYAALGFQKDTRIWISPLMLCIGALINGTLNYILLLRDPFRPLRKEIAIGYKALSVYFSYKAKLLKGDDVGYITKKLSESNIGVVTSLERIKSLLNIYSKDVDRNVLKKYLNYFIILQNLHERAASSIVDFSNVSENNASKDLSEGFYELFHQLSHASEMIYNSLIEKKEYKHPIAIRWIIIALKERIGKLSNKNKATFGLFLYNLERSHKSLLHLYDEKYMSGIPRLQEDNVLVKDYLRDVFVKFNSVLKYSFRVAFGFFIGKMISLYFNIPNGDWIVLTILLVSQNSYRDTRKRLSDRVLGTILGVLVGAFLLYILPNIAGQLVMLFISVFLFYYLAPKSYSIAVIYITIYVIFSSQILMENGLYLIQPRIICTLIGGFLAFFMNRLFWPDWQYKLLPNLTIKALEANGKYYFSILHESNDLKFRIARRNAHIADNNLTKARQSIEIEPRKHRGELSKATRLIFLNHALISHLSALAVLRTENFKDEDFLLKIRSCLEDVFNDNSKMYKLNNILLLLRKKLDYETSETKVSFDYIYRLYYNVANVLRKIIIGMESK